MKKKPFPKVLYVARVEEGTDNEFLSADEDASRFGEIGETKLVAEYALVEVLEVSGTVQVRQTKK